MIAKIFEKVIFDQTYKFLCDNKVLSESQSGFFLLYVNDLSSSCDLLSDEHLYVDHTTLTYANNDFDQILTVMNRDLHALDDWLNKNKLSLNVIKTKCMFIGTRQKLATLPS